LTFFNFGQPLIINLSNSLTLSKFNFSSSGKFSIRSSPFNISRYDPLTPFFVPYNFLIVFFAILRLFSHAFASIILFIFLVFKTLLTNQFRGKLKIFVIYHLLEFLLPKFLFFFAP